ncbi:hypothetical protein [Streptomyces sp. NPDC050504]|uniref:hypothetical protein n=1 Tax=Streptomyces sp. NPDC050504 TaxID=3365618 RepID=UPI0037A9DA99
MTQKAHRGESLPEASPKTPFDTSAPSTLELLTRITAQLGAQLGRVTLSGVPLAHRPGPGRQPV